MGVLSDVGVSGRPAGAGGGAATRELRDVATGDRRAAGGPQGRGVSGRLIVAVAFVATLAAVGFALATRGELVRNLRPPAPAPKLYGNAVWSPGKGPVGRLGMLRAVASSPGRPSDLKGRVVVLTFMDSHCTTLCPLEASELAGVRSLMGSGTPVELVVVSTDPKGDTPASVASFARRSGWAGRWRWEWLSGSTAQLRSVWAAYGIGVQSTVAHTSVVFVVDRRGDTRAAMGVPFPRQILASDVRSLS